MHFLALLCLRALAVLAVTASLVAPPPQSRAAETAQWDDLADPVFRSFGSESGLPDPISQASVEDGQGYLWVATQSGLFRFDGYRFRKYQADPARTGSLPNNLVQSLHTDAAGRLWLGTFSGDLARYDPATDGFTTYPQSLTPSDHEPIWSIAEDRSGTIWAGTDGGLRRVDPKDGATTIIRHDPADPDSLPDDHIRPVMIDRHGAMWVGTRAGLVRSDDHAAHFRAVALPVPGGSTADIQSLFEDDSGTLWIGTRMNGAFRLGPDGVATAVPLNGANSGGPATYRVPAITEARKGEIWFSVLGAGIVALDTASQRTRRVTRIPGNLTSLPSDTIWNFYRGAAGQLWISHGRGLSRYDASQSAILTVSGASGLHGALSDPDIVWVAQSPEGGLAIDVANAGIMTIDPTQAMVGPYRAANGIYPKHINAAAISRPGGVVYFATEAGLYRGATSGGAAALIPLPDRDPHGRVDVLLAEQGRLWVGSQLDGLWRLDLRADGAVDAVTHIDSAVLTDPRIQAIIPGPAPETLWVGTRNGLNLLDVATARAERIAADAKDASGLSDGFISALATDASGRLWVGAYGGGINVMTGRDESGRPRFRHIRGAQGLSNDVIDAMLMDKSGRVWASTDDGLNIVDPTDLTVRALGRGDGVAVSSYWAGSAATMRDGALVFGGAGGLTIVRPDRLVPWTYQPPVVISDIRVAGTAVNAGPRGDKPLVVPPNADSIAIEFASLDYTAPSNIRYAYKLEGYNAYWIDADAAHRTATYTKLPPGDYTLLVRGSNRDGQWSAGHVALAIRVLPAWYQWRWLKLLGIAALAGLVWLLVLSRTGYLRRRQRILEQQVGERTIALDHSNRALALSVETLRELDIVGREITANLEVEALFLTLYRHAEGLLGATRFVMYLTNPATGRPIASFGVERGERLSPGAALGDDPANHVDRAYDERKLVSHSVDTIESGEGSGMGSLLAAPLISEGTALGVLLVQSDRPEPYGEREQLILGTLSGYGAIALANAKALEALARARAMLEEFAYFDPLTSLPNRRKFLDGYRQSIALARREGRGFALLLIDLDRLKVANDTLGHDAGDFLLVQAAAWLKESVRETDIVARVGGDEFAIVLTDIHSIAAVEQVCGRMVAIFESKIAFRGNALATSPSIGIALFPQDGDHGDALYKAADLALFEAKRAGRNTWRWFRPGMAA